MIPYYILAIEDETDRAYMTALFFQYQKLMYSTIQKVTNDHWLIDDIFQTSFEHLIGKIDLLKDLDRNRLVNYLIVTCRNTAYNMCRSYSAHITEDLDEYATILPDETQPSHLDDYLIQKDRLSSLKSIWPKLDTRSQNLLEAKYILGKLDSDIAKELDIKEASVRMALSRARKKAYELIKRDAGIDVSSIWRVIVISDTGLSASQAMPFPHGDLSINQDLIGIVENPVQDRLGNGAALIRIWMEPFIPVPRLVLCAEDHGSLIAPGLNYFQQTIGFLRRQAPDQPFVQNQQIIFLVRFNKGCSGRKIFT